ncbi:hypothetical protein PCANC_04736 [Puccinia coronata f. sp. avenae]|uniref:Retrovirus-related Pol polyprotein from transposon TNT 1-94-like beta-barrel domain-containing protein n=1 Tax=Puccinia coronata f. sp. avenae TaxID=200324 RepID=A0A2N5VWP5_9BASI|nr:hypothetical protein PCANC_04736 [Puccinia coronata f. sp. avenae]
MPSYAPYTPSYSGRAPVSNPGLRPADSYRPNYQQQAPPSGCQPAVREVEMDYGTGDQPMAPPHDKAPPNVSFSIATSNATPSTIVVFDTGATHHVTGDRSALMDFKLLNYPIPLRVATNGTTRFITGQGKMIFAGPNSTCIQLDGVLYCSFVTNTLISPVSLRLASFRIGGTPFDVHTPIRTPRKNGVQPLHAALERRAGAARLSPHAARHVHAYNRRAYGVQACQTGVQSLHACLKGVQSLHALRTGVQALHACRLT